MNRESVFPIFFIVWIILGIAGSILFYFNKSIEFKKKYFRWFVVLAGFLFILFAGIGAPWQVVLFFLLPGVSLITYLNIKNTKFCNICGSTIFNNAWFSKVEYCSKCGAKLEK